MKGERGRRGGEVEISELKGRREMELSEGGGRKEGREEGRWSEVKGEGRRRGGEVEISEGGERKERGGGGEE